MTASGLDNLAREARERMLRQDYAAAEALSTEVLRHDPRHTGALVVMAQILTERAEFAAAREHMARLIRAQPRSATHRTNLAQIYAAEGRYGEALVQFEKALKLAPDLVPALAGKAAVLERQNKHARAASLLKPAVRGAATPPVVAAVYLRLLIHGGRLDEAIEVGRAVVDAAAEPSMPLRDTCFELARAYERSGRFEEAFAAARRGNEMLPAPFDPERHRRTVQSFIDVFSRDRLATLPRSETRSELPVFIVGMPRCGSTLTERIIASHPEAHGAGEINTFGVLVRDLPQRLGATEPYPQCVPSLDAAGLTAFGEAYVEALSGFARKAKRITNKDLGNYRHVGLIHLALPGARVIHCRRDPLDTCLSCYMERLLPASTPWAADLRNLAVFHHAYERLMRHWAEVLDAEILEIDYEALVGDPEATTRRIIAFTGLPWNDACLAFHEGARTDQTLSYDQVRRPVYRTSIGRAERFGALLDPLRQAMEQEGTENRRD